VVTISVGGGKAAWFNTRHEPSLSRGHGRGSRRGAVGAGRSADSG
jgi:hypothetical protein